MKKIICPYCNSVLQVEDDAESAECSYCKKEIDVEQAKRIMQIEIAKYYNYANAELYASTQYEKAVHNYMMVLSYDETLIDAIVGLSLSTLYCSTLNETHLDNVLSVLKKYHATLHEEKNAKTVGEFLTVLDHSLNVYIQTLLVRTSLNNKFISEKARDNYLKALNDSINILDCVANKIISAPIEAITHKSKKDYVSDINKLKKLHEKHYGVDLKLHVEDSNVERVFLDKRKAYKSASIYLVSLIVSSIILIVGLILLFSVWGYWYIGGSITLVGLIGTIVFYVLRKKAKNKILN